MNRIEKADLWVRIFNSILVNEVAAAKGEFLISITMTASETDKAYSAMLKKIAE